MRQKCVQQLDRNLQAENGSVTARHIEAWTIEQLEAALTSSRSATEERRRDQVTSVLKLRAALLDLSRLAKVKEPSGLSELDSALSQLFVVCPPGAYCQCEPTRAGPSPKNRPRSPLRVGREG